MAYPGKIAVAVVDSGDDSWARAHAGELGDR